MARSPLLMRLFHPVGLWVSCSTAGCLKRLAVPSCFHYNRAREGILCGLVAGRHLPVGGSGPGEVGINSWLAAREGFPCAWVA